jgi:hypothetical protein
VDSKAGISQGIEMSNKDNTRAKAAKFFIDQLNSRLYRDAATLRKLDQRNDIPAPLRVATLELFKQATRAIDQFFTNPESITKTDEKNVEALRMTLEKFDKTLMGVMCRMRSFKALKYTASHIRHFCYHFHLTLHSFTPGARLPNPPTNLVAQAEWLKQIAALGSSKKIPRWKVLNRLVFNTTGYDLPQRTHRDWLSQLSKGTFLHLIQKRQ